jgi:hypothetical protein
MKVNEEIRPLCQRCVLLRSMGKRAIIFDSAREYMPYNSFGAPSSAAAISLGAHKCWWGESPVEQVFAVQKRVVPLRVLWRNYAINTNVSN